LLTNLETASEKLVQIVLSGQPELEQKLRNPCVRQLRQRVSLWCRTRPLTSEETLAYIAKRLQIAGASQPVLSPEAMQLVYRYSKGIPRLINLICEHAMLSAYVEQIKPIPARIVELVSMELDIVQRPFVISPMSMSGLPDDSWPTSVSSTINPAAEFPDFLEDI
jgi:type II secretory pathway predicted ATPase ExeA